MRRVDLAVDLQILGVGLPANPAVWTDVLMHQGDFLASREPICDSLGDGLMRHSQLPSQGRSDLFGALDIFDELPILYALPIGSRVEQVPQLFLRNPFERTRHG